jgi:hypothetical protein
MELIETALELIGAALELVDVALELVRLELIEVALELIEAASSEELTEARPEPRWGSYTCEAVRQNNFMFIAFC